MQAVRRETVPGSDFIPMPDFSNHIGSPRSMWVWSDFYWVSSVVIILRDAVQVILCTLQTPWGRTWGGQALEDLFWGRTYHISHKTDSGQVGFRGSKLHPKHPRDHTTAASTGDSMRGLHVCGYNHSPFFIGNSEFCLFIYKCIYWDHCSQSEPEAPPCSLSPRDVHQRGYKGIWVFTEQSAYK